MTDRMPNVEIRPAVYWSIDGLCRGTDVLYRRNGKPTSARLPFVCTSKEEAINYITSLNRRIRPLFDA